MSTHSRQGINVRSSDNPIKGFLENLWVIGVTCRSVDAGCLQRACAGSTPGSVDSREAISRVCEAVPGAKGAFKKRKIIANHHMQSISFASGGDPDTTDYVAYVAKDPVNRREPFEDALKNQPLGPVLSKAASVECISPVSPRAPDAKTLEELDAEPWYQGEMSRKEAEALLQEDGDFLVRKSTTNPGSFVLTGMHNGQAKHLLLVDPEGTTSFGLKSILSNIEMATSACFFGLFA
ncbi:SHC-transforming protein 3 [Cricetulus griseus]|uniref:SHC-transforming protein 3 n=1 Tax=Cricetulus griseus TaxID=10029 RepID=A0A061ICB0_CRIGR|nr:SHC-transforming protein 3 [Cricetulus griseus]